MKSVRILTIASSLILLSIPALGQVVTGTYPFGPFAGGPDAINLGTLNASWTIPIVNKAGRGLNFAYNLNYDSSVYYPVTSGSTTSWQPVANWGWQGLNTAGFVYATYKVVYTSGTCGQYGQYSWQSWVYSNLTYSDEHGVVHFFTGAGGTYTSATGTTGCPASGASPSGTLSTQAADASGLIANFTTSSSGFSTTISLKNGTTITPPMFTSGSGPTGSYYAEDSNGNELSSSAGSYTDTLGTTALSVMGVAPSNTTFTYLNPAGSYVDYAVSYQPYNIMTNFGCSGVTEYSATGVDLVNEIELSDGRTYQFTYEATPGHSGYVTGRPASVVLPTGGTISYAYTGGSNGINCTDGSASGLTRTTPDGTWTYTRSLNSSSEWTTTATAPSYSGVQDQTVSTFLTNKPTGYLPGASFYEIERQLYSGSSSLLETVLTCYETNTAYCSTTVGDSGTDVAALTNIQGTTQWPNSSGISSGYVNTYDTSGDNLTNAIYDYGSGGTFGSLLQTTTSTYTSSYGGEQPSQVTVTDGASSTISETKYNYSSAVVATSSTPQHVGGYNLGNLSSVQTLVSGSTFLTTSYTYFDTGNVQTVTDPNGTGVTTYTYNSTGCANSFRTGTSTPVKNPAGTVTATLTTSAVWNCQGGVQTSTTDANSNVTTYSYGSDPYWRPTSVTSNATGATENLGYQTSSSNTSSSSMSFNSGSSTASTTTTYDSQGRPEIIQTLQAPGSTNYDSVAIAYDSRGRTASQTQPYTATLGTYTTVPTNPGFSTTYDALNRQLLITDGGGGTTAYTYSTNASISPPSNNTLVTLGPAPSGENTKRRLLAHNAAGQLTSVCEVTSLTGSGSCGSGSGQTGYLTKYAYDAVNLTQTQQNAQTGSSGVQTRSLSSYDGLGRYASETIPEWSAGSGAAGASSYVYDSVSSGGCTSSSAGDMVESTDHAGNVTCYNYDSTHRLLSSTVVSGTYQSVTPSSYYVYDAAAYSGTTMQNAAGQLAEAYTCSGSCTSKLTDIFFSASPVNSGIMAGGVETQMWESTPHSSGYFLTTDTYYPNGAVGSTSASLSGASISVPNVTFGLDGEGRPYSATDTTNSLNLVTSTTYNNSGNAHLITYGNASTGAAADTDTFSYTEYAAHDTPTQFLYSINPTSGAFTFTGNLTWNTNNSLASLTITDTNDSSKNQSCSYSADDLSRIASVNCGTSTWAQNFSYDPFGNISKTVPSGGTGTAYGATYNTATNQVSGGSITPTPTYDGNGNQLTSFPASLTWNALNQPIMVNGAATASYDALGRMVETGSSGTYKQTFYHPSGTQYGRYSGGVLVKGFVNLPGGATAVYGSTGIMYIRRKDWLGSSPLATTWTHTVASNEAYAPFGEAYNEAGTQNRIFTGQDQVLDNGSGGDANIYDFLFRKYDPSAGRWLSPDPSGWSAVNPAYPQSLDRYAYVQNNPLSLVDVDGLDCTWQNSDGLVSTSEGDCPTSGPGANGAYIDCDGCAAGATIGFDNNGDYTGYCNSGGCFDSDGNPLPTFNFELPGIGTLPQDISTTVQQITWSIEEGQVPFWMPGSLCTMGACGGGNFVPPSPLLHPIREILPPKFRK